MTAQVRLHDDIVAAIAKSGRCYPHEARSMACELMARRVNQPSAGCRHHDAFMRATPAGVMETHCPDCGKVI